MAAVFVGQNVLLARSRPDPWLVPSPDGFHVSPCCPPPHPGRASILPAARGRMGKQGEGIGSAAAAPQGSSLVRLWCAVRCAAVAPTLCPLSAIRILLSRSFSQLAASSLGRNRTEH